MAGTDFVAGVSRTSWPGSGDTLDKLYGVYLEKVLLDSYYARLGIDRFADLNALRANSGEKYIWYRMATKSSPTAAAGRGVNATQTKRVISTVEASIARYQDADGIPKEDMFNAVLNIPEGISTAQGVEAAVGVEQLVFLTISSLISRCLSRMSSKINNWNVGVIASLGSTTTVKMADMPAAKKGQEYWARISTGGATTTVSTVTILDGPCEGETRLVTNWNNTTTTAIVGTAFQYDPAVGADGSTLASPPNRYQIARNVGHATGLSGISASLLIDVRAQLSDNRAIPFGGSQSDYRQAGNMGLQGDYAGCLTFRTYADLFTDADIKTFAQQGDTWKNRYGYFQLVRYAGIILQDFSLTWRSNAPATAIQGGGESLTYQKTGVVHHNLFLGKDSFGMVRPEKAGGEGPAALNFYYSTPDEHSTDQSTKALAAIIAYDFYFGTVVKHAGKGINLLTAGLK